MNPNPFDDSYAFWYNPQESKAEGPEPEEDPNFVASDAKIEALCDLFDKELDKLTINELMIFCARMISRFNKK
ncbi:MAG: hypothetical protein IM488_18305 [Microcystis sp. M025S2]|uniref:hypothetical protein n=1 Tax=Microcystis sp. M025S2 TaxID=2771161 RepID=UPI00259008DE|nr:hypothetical protein [Microcystis sp. M025S2]MCA2711281.1 hypothetical protein [Microcystis sp. M025S2]